MTNICISLLIGEDKKSDLYWEQDFYHPNGNIVYDCQGYSIKGSGKFFPNVLLV